MLLCVKKGKGKKCSSNTTLQNVSIPNNVTMITLFYENDNMFNQDTYDNSDSNMIMSQCIQVDNVPIGTLSTCRVKL